MTIPKIGKDLKDRMKESIMKTPFGYVLRDERTFESFALCDVDGKVVGDQVVEGKGDDIELPERCTIVDEPPVGFFFVQGERNGDPNHVISRSALKIGFLEMDYDFVCSGYAQKIMTINEGGGGIITKKPKLLCVAPKEGATKVDMERAINDLDRVYNPWNAFNSNRYINTLRKAFDTKRWTLK